MRILLAALLALAACDSAATDDVDVSDFSQDAAALVGTWDWEQSVYHNSVTGEPGVVRPRSASEAETYVFGVDGTVSVYRGGVLDRSDTYEVRRFTRSDGVQSSVPYLFIGSNVEWFGIDGDLLYFDDRASDGPLARYRRR